MNNKETAIEEVEVNEIQEEVEDVEDTAVERVEEPSMLENIMNVLNTCREEDSNSYIWNGIEINIKRTLSVYEMKVLFDTVLDRCFDDEDGSYHPEYRDFAERASLISLYSDTTLPENIEDQYDFVYKTDIYDFVSSHVDVTQYSALFDALDEKIKEAVDGKTREIEKTMHMVTNLVDMFNTMFDGVNAKDVSSALKSISENGIDEKAIVDAIINK